MYTAVTSAWALFLGIGLLMLGNGLQGSLLGLRAQMEGFSTAITGVIMSGYYAGFLAGSIFAPAVVSRVGQAGQCDASPRGGKPGFIKVLDERHLLIPDVAGNRLFHSYQNVAANNQVGLLFFIPGNNNTARVNGTVEVLDKDELDRRQIDLESYFGLDKPVHLAERRGRVVEYALGCGAEREVGAR